MADTLIIKSDAFTNDGDIPVKFTCEGANVNPPLQIDGIPEATKSLALIMEDPDAPRGTFYHWLVWNIPPQTTNIEEKMRRGISGENGFGRTGYGGPCPPTGKHRYFFKIYALDTELDLEAGADHKTLQGAMKDHIIAQGELMGHYKKQQVAVR